MFGHVLRARLLILQFSKTAFFLKRVATERKKGLRISVFFSVLIYNIGNNKVLCVLLGVRTGSDEAKTLWWLCWLLGGETSPDEAAGAKALCGRDLKCPQTH